MTYPRQQEPRVVDRQEALGAPTETERNATTPDAKPERRTGITNRPATIKPTPTTGARAQAAAAASATQFHTTPRGRHSFLPHPPRQQRSPPPRGDSRSPTPNQTLPPVRVSVRVSESASPADRFRENSSRPMPSHEACCGTMFWVYLMSCVGLVMFAGLMSGLTLGLMSLSLVDLEVLAKAGTPKDKLNAARILPVVKNQHLLLCTLLIGNSLAMEALPVFLDTLVPSYVAILISVTLILAFGEIMPQAICTRYGLSVGAMAAPVVRILLIVFFPVAYPISKLLDKLLGKGHFALMRRAELKTLVDMHGNEAGKGGELTHDETTIITGALEMTQKIAKDAMTPISDTFSLDINAKLDLHTMGMIMTRGHSRVPIYSGSPSNIIGLILVKNLITCRTEDEVPIRNVTIRKIPRVADDLPLYDILNEFQKGHSHMAVVVTRTKETGASSEKHKSATPDYKINIKDTHADGSSPLHVSTAASRRNNTEKFVDGRSYTKKSERKRINILDFNTDPLPSYSMDEEAVGIITMEDVMEELLQEEIYDETDEYVDVHNKIRINMLPPGKSLSPVISPGGGPLSQGLRWTSVASPFSPYHHGSSVIRSPVSNHVQSPGTLPTILSPGGSPPACQTPMQSSPKSTRVSRNPDEKHKKDGES